MKKKKLKKEIKKLESRILWLNYLNETLQHKNKLLNTSVNKQREQLNAKPLKPDPWWMRLGHSYPCIDPKD